MIATQNTMNRAFSACRVSEGRDPRALPWADMKQAVGLEEEDMKKAAAGLVEGEMKQAGVGLEEAVGLEEGEG